MTAAVLIGDVMVLAFGASMCVAPLVTRPSLQFGVRVPPGYGGAPVIRRERRVYQWRSALIAIAALAALIALGDHAAPWTSRLIVVVEVGADLGCVWRAHNQIARVKSAQGWFAGRRQIVVADTSWRTDPEAFPARWLLPAVAVIAVTVIVGVVRYPHLPAYLTSGGHRVATSPASAFAVVAGQLYVTGLWTGLLLLAYRSRPDLDATDPAASLRRHRRALGLFGRSGLILLACVDATVLLVALGLWRVLHLSGGANVLVAVPLTAGLAGFLVTVRHAGSARALTVARGLAASRDDDRYWKGGIVYINPADPAVLVGARVGFGWTVNFGNPIAWLLVTGLLAIPVALVILKVVTGI
ncbi:MAG: DUF1648 domain-containing protein [Streptosporangiaceae bacterium]